MYKVQDIVQGWEINTSSDFGDILKPQYVQQFSKLKFQTLNQKSSQKTKQTNQTELMREKKLRINSSYSGQKSMSQRKENKQKLYPIQMIMLEQQNQQSIIFQEYPLISQRVKPSTSLNSVLRRKNIYLQSILKQVNQFVCENKNTKSRSVSIMSVNQSPRYFARSNIQNGKYI